MPPNKEQSVIQLRWTTVTYRSVLLAILAVVAAASTATYFIFPSVQPVVNTAGVNILAKVKQWVGIKTISIQGDNLPRQARFTSFDGTVRVRKANVNYFVPADYSLPLEKGDVVQTMSEGIAKVSFPDGSTYNIQPDSLITIEENTTDAQQQTQATVRLDTGQFVLDTGNQVSTQQVKIDQTTTTVGKDSALEAKNDRKTDTHEVMVTKGAGVFEIANQKTPLAPYEKVQFKPDTGAITKVKEIAPPVLLAPANMMPILVSAMGKPVDFNWTPMDGVRGYHIRISRNPYFSSIEKEAKVNEPAYRATGLGEGKYYWVVQSIDAKGAQSIESEKNAFSIVKKGNESVTLRLELDPFVQISHVIELKGRTEPGARVMVNGQQVPVIGDDGAFTFFTQQLPSGENVITVTAQNEKGGVSTQTQKVVIQ